MSTGKTRGVKIIEEKAKVCLTCAHYTQFPNTVEKGCMSPDTPVRLMDRTDAENFGCIHHSERPTQGTRLDEAK